MTCRESEICEDVQWHAPRPISEPYLGKSLHPLSEKTSEKSSWKTHVCHSSKYGTKSEIGENVNIGVLVKRPHTFSVWCTSTNKDQALTNFPLKVLLLKGSGNYP